MLNLCVSDGISVPAVAIPLWVVVALVVTSWDAQGNLAEFPMESGGQFAFLRRVLPIPVCAILVMAYGGMLLRTARGSSLARQSLRAQEYLRMDMNPLPGEAVPEQWAKELHRGRVRFVRQQILHPLEVAFESNPEDARYLQSLANWTGVAWQMTDSEADRDSAWRYALRIQGLDPLSRDAWLTEANLCTMFCHRFQLRSWNPTLAVSTPWGPFPNLQLPSQPLGALVRLYNEPRKTEAAKLAQLELERAANALAEAVRLGPTQTYVRFQFVAGLQVAGHRTEAQREARRLLDIDRRTTHRSRRLTYEQREQIQRWLDNPNK
jgi:hypothetical protein